MKSLFNAADAEDIRQRIQNLHSGNERVWGKMTLAQTLAHCTSGMQMATGAIKPKRAPFPASLLGIVIKPMVLGNDKPMRRDSPSAPELFTFDRESCEFERERTQLLATIDEFLRSPVCSQHPHPFFGPLKAQEWAILMHKHLDHHLRQFSA